ncbi:MAG TPA: hypothetical protein VF543_03420 [Pyrinomonadaceae bacterium]|jgi:methionine-rich copper-binding protein CopC
MLKGITVLQKRIFICGIVCALTLCGSLWLISDVALAMTTNSQAGNALNIVVSSTGCTPSSATKSPGQITLKVTNQTGEAGLAVQLYGSKGELIREAYIQQGATEWSETFDLLSGSYTLKAGHNPDWTCQITIQ